MSRLVVNNTVLSNFAGVGRLDMLREVLGSFCVPTQVYSEVLTGIAVGYAFLTLVRDQVLDTSAERWIFVIELKANELALYNRLLATLGKGEAACLAIAKSRGWGLLTDDKKARKIAEQESVRLSGTLGVLRLGVKRGCFSLSEADEVLKAMIEKGYRSPFRSIGQLLEDQEGQESQ
ncbi:MAG: DUF3368 domain-containing protein [Anaerolineae bacterium]